MSVFNAGSNSSVAHGIRTGVAGGDHSFLESVRGLHELVDASTEAQLCIEYLASDLVENGFVCLDSNESVDCDAYLRQLILQVVRCLTISGFCVWRKERKRRRTPVQSTDFMIANSRMVSIRLENGKWVPEMTDSSSPRAYRDWNVICLAHPHTSGGSTGHPQSPAWIVKQDMEKVAILQDLFLSAEENNSTPRVLTQIEPQLTTDPTTGTPWYSMLIPNSGGTTDDLASSRLQFVRETARVTAALRTQNVEDRPGGGFSEQQVSGVFHQESALTDGMRVTHVLPRCIMNPEYRAMLNRYRSNVMLGFGVPPSSLGEQMNSERVGGSQIVVSRAGAMAESRVRRLRLLLLPLLEAAGLKFAVSVPKFQVNEILPLLNLDSAVEVLATSYHIPPDMIDRERVQQRQEMLLNAKEKETRLSAEQKRAKKSDADKLITETLKGESRKDTTDI